MPFSARSIDEKHLYTKHLLGTHVKLQGKKAIETCSATSMIGAIKQLGILAQHANEIMSDLFEETLLLESRLVDMSRRTSTVLDIVHHDLYVSQDLAIDWDKQSQKVNPSTLGNKKMFGFFRKDEEPREILKR